MAHGHWLRVGLIARNAASVGPPGPLVPGGDCKPQAGAVGSAQSAGTSTCTNAALEMASARPVVESRIRNLTAAGSWRGFCHVSTQDPSPDEYENETRKGARSSTTGSVNFNWLVETAASPNGANGVRVRTSAIPWRSELSAIRTTSRPGAVLGPTADRTSVTADAVPSKIGNWDPRFGVMNSDADRSAARRSKATANSSL